MRLVCPVSAAALILCALPPATSRAEFHAQDWELTLAATARNDSDFSEFSIGKTGSLGYFATRELEFGLRDSIVYTDIGRETMTAIRLETVADWHFPLGRTHTFVPFVGANLGYQWGKNVHDTWYAGPEAGIKWFVKHDTFLFGRIAWEINFDTTGDSSRDQQILYQIGVGFRL